MRYTLKFIWKEKLPKFEIIITHTRTLLSLSKWVTTLTNLQKYACISQFKSNWATKQWLLCKNVSSISSSSVSYFSGVTNDSFSRFTFSARYFCEWKQSRREDGPKRSSWKIVKGKCVRTHARTHFIHLHCSHVNSLRICCYSDVLSQQCSDVGPSKCKCTINLLRFHFLPPSSLPSGAG